MSIHQEIAFNCQPRAVYDALTDAEQFAKLTDVPAEIVAQAGGAFSCFDGMISGQTIEAIPGERLVQAWRVFNWEPGVYSIVSFKLEALAGGDSKIIFDHTGYPEEFESHLESGWHEKYWRPMKNYLGT